MDTGRLFHADAVATGNMQLFDFLQNVLTEQQKKMKTKQIYRTDDDCADDDGQGC